MSLLVQVLNWFATHLVALGFLSFVLVGIFLAGGMSEETAEPRVNAAELSKLESGSLDGQANALLVENGSSAERPGPSADQTGTPSDVLASESPLAKNVLSQASTPEPEPVFRPAVSKANLKPPASTTQFRDPDKQPLIEDPSPERVVDERLALARQTLSRDDLSSAETHYLRYLSERPEDAEAFAELGNLYRAMDRLPDAMDAYYEAAVRFGDRGEWGEVQQLAGILTRAGDARADSLLAPSHR